MRPLSAHSGLRGPPLNLCQIIQRGYLSQVPLLVNLGANLEARDDTGRTPLMLTAYVQPEEWGVGVARLLIEMGVRMDLRDKYGMNALHHACVYERLELGKVLLNALDFDLLQEDKFGNTALHYAAMTGNQALVKLLLFYHNKYRLSLTKSNRNSRTAGEEAFLYRHFACAELLDAASLTQSKFEGQTEYVSKTTAPVPKIKTGVAGEYLKEVHGGEPLMVATKTTELSQLNEGDIGGLYPHYHPDNQQKVMQKLKGVYQASPRSDQSSRYSKTKSTESSPSSRKSGVRRPQSAFVRRLSIGSDARSCRSDVGSSPRHSKLSDRRIIKSNLENNLQTTQNVQNEPVQVGEILTSRKHPNNPPESTRLRENINLLNSRETLQASSICEAAVKLPHSKKLRKELTFLGKPKSLSPAEKDSDRFIYVVPENDFRNTPEYVLKLTRMENHAANLDVIGSSVRTPAPPAMDMCEEETRKKVTGSVTWRDTLRILFRYYEDQCSLSWRNAAKPPPEPAQGDELDGGSVREKSGRRPGSSQRPGSQLNDVSSSSITKHGRKSHSSKQRKTTSTSPSSTPAQGTSLEKGQNEQGIDTSFASSVDSVTGSLSLKKKRPDKKQDQGYGSTLSPQNISKTTSDGGISVSGSESSAAMSVVSSSCSAQALTEITVPDSDAETQNTDPEMESSRLTVLSDINED